MIILTGGAGFIGSCLLNKLNINSISDVLVVDRLGTDDKWKNLVQKRFSGYLHKDEFRKLLKNGDFNGKADLIVHLGACTVTTERDADYIFDNNLNYSIELAEFALKNNARFIYASSAATYGDGSEGYSDRQFDNLKPMNAYGLSKHLFDLWVLDRKLDERFTGLKFFNVFGPNEYHKDSMASMIYKSFNQINQTGRVKLFKSNHPDYSDGGQMRDFIYVKDVVNIIWKIIEKKDFSGIFNLGTGKARNWNDLTAAVFSAMDKDVNVDYIEMPESLINQYQNYTQAEMTKLVEAGIDYDFPTLEKSVDDYIRNYLSTEWQYL